MNKQVFVAREQELAQLDGFLKQAIVGHGSVCFVIGEAGRGKTALINEFSHRSLNRYPNLAIAIGQSDAQTGVGDAHLPFREVLKQLTGDVETKLAQGVITKENANRLRKLLVLSGQALVEVGPDLIGVFIPGAGLAMRVGAFAVEKVGWMDKLENLAGKKSEAPELVSSGIRSDNIYEQYTNVVCKLSENQPLLLILDDLQWADAASIGLLFHLARRIGNHRILLIGTYRPEEVAIDRAGERHPLEKVVNELKRYYGNIWVDLDKADSSEGKCFVDDFLNTEPNQLGKDFRQKLFDHTGGHPLFTIELLRAMQERGDLIMDKQNRWVETSMMNWNSLPKRVEGVIEERISRLREELQQILKIGSVEGEDFTAEVIAQIESVELLDLVRRLSRELEKQHRLITARGIHQLETTGRRISFYRFQHNLFQKYLYNELDEIERTILHENVGNALEELYRAQMDLVVVQLARHFEQARIPEKAHKYLYLAGKQSAERFANTEAISYFNRALNLTPENHPEIRFTILLDREHIYGITGERELRARDLASLENLAQILGDDHKKAELALRQALYADSVSDYQAQINFAQKTIILAQTSQDASIQASGNLIWGLALRHQGEYQAALQKFKAAQVLASTAKLPLLEAKSLANIGSVFSRTGDHKGSVESLENALALYRELSDLRGEAETLQILCGALLDYGDYNDALTRGEEALSIYKRIGYRKGEGNIQGNLGIICAQKGDYSKARGYFQKAIEISKETGERGAQAAALNNLGNLALRQDDYIEARECLTQVLGICREIGNRRGEGITLNNLANVTSQECKYDMAIDNYKQALDVFRDIGDRNSEGTVLCQSGILYLALGKYSVAREYLEQSLIISREIGDKQTESEALGGFGVLALKFGMYSDAKTALNQSMEMIREIGDRQLEGKILAYLCWLSLFNNEYDQAVEFSRQAIKISQELGERSNQARALNFLGYSLEALNNLPDAINAYQQSMNLRREIGQFYLAVESIAGLARISLMNDRPGEALEHVEDILSYLEGNRLEGLDEPMRVYLTCYRVLMANQDFRASELLIRAYRLIQECSAEILNEETRCSYLENVAIHREIMEEFLKLKY